MQRETVDSTTGHADPLETILARAQVGLQQGLFPAEVFSNDLVFQAEMERVFYRNWVFVGFESEIPRVNDYVLRRIGTDEVILTRGSDGKINVISNFCRHRGTQLCQVDRGNSSRFVCSYHGWTYRNNGEFVGAPHMQAAYKGLDRQSWGLLRAPHVESIHGLIFACLSKEAPSLREYLGDALWFLDALVGLHPDGMQVIGPPERYRVRGDWKSAADNFAGDVYHVDVLHISTEKIKVSAGLELVNEHATHYVTDLGHVFQGHGYTKMFGPEWELWGYPPEIKSQFDMSTLSAAQANMVRHDPPVVGTIFPNLSFLRFNGRPGPGRPHVVFTSWRQWQPVGPGVFELWNWQMKWNFYSEEQARASYDAGQFGFSSAGIFEQDDTVVWEGAAKAARSVWTRKSNTMFNYQMGLDGIGVQTQDMQWKGPGRLYRPGPGEPVHRAFYGRWLQDMQNARD